MDQIAQIAQLQAENAALRAEIVELKKLILELREEIKSLKNGRNSKTSSSPPSKDIGRSNKHSLREKTGKLSGGQKGHKGGNLEMSKSPDEIIEYRPESTVCQGCGEILDPKNYTLQSRKQVIEIPPILPKYIEHRAFGCVCTHCKQKNVGKIPSNLSANIQYGASVIAHVVHFSAAQYIPYNRIVEIMKNTFNLSISEGSIHNILTQFSTKIAPAAYEEIRSDVAQSAVVGGDETGIRVNGKNAWLFTVQTEKATFLFAKESRGFQSLNDEFPEGFPEAIYVSDCLPAQIKVAAKGHQICIAHLLRELENFKVAFACNFATRFQSFFRDTIKMGHRGKNVPISEVYELEARLDALLAENLAGKYHKTQAFQSRLIKYRDYILTFLYHERVPPDNNGSERSIRTAKVKMKVSGGFRTMQGAQNFAILRSIIDSAKKNGLNAFDAIFNLVKNHAFA